MYPHFGDIKDEHIGVTDSLQAIPSPGVEVAPSECGVFYQTRDFDQATEDCRVCLDLAASADRQCPCILQSTSKGDLCDYAQCVENAYQRDATNCAKSYAALYNLDDVQDGSFIPPFTYEQTTCKRSRSPRPAKRRPSPPPETGGACNIL